MTRVSHHRPTTVQAKICASSISPTTCSEWSEKYQKIDVSVFDLKMLFSVRNNGNILLLPDSGGEPLFDINNVGSVVDLTDAAPSFLLTFRCVI